MKKLFLLFYFTVCVLQGAFSQAGEWTWMKGDSLYNQAGTFGTQGVPSPSNNPPGFYEPMEWQDHFGNFWLFGGWNGGAYDDIWKFNPATNEWTWMKGSGTTTQNPVYGTQGIPSILNTPGNQQWCGATWVDTVGNFWLFGGSNGGSSNYNLLWKFDISTNEWTWIKGSTTCCQTGIFGSAGIPNSANTPGSRWETNATWVDDNGDLWLLGGLVTNANSSELWKYSISTNMWTWILPTNPISNGQVYSKWKDGNGDFWLFGGGSSSFPTNDLWKYNISANQWTLIGNSQTINNNIICQPDSISYPSARVESRACWTDSKNNFWLFGGYAGGSFNDLWAYCPSGNMWTWVKGSQFPNQTAVFGTQGVPNINNRPSSRFGSIGWKDTVGNLWLYAGWVGGSNSSGDLWKFTIDTTCGVCPTSTNILEIDPNSQLQIFPNPSNITITISFSASSNQSCEIKIFNTLGEDVYFSKEEMHAEKFEKEISVQLFRNGIYFVQVKTGEEMLSKKIVVQH